jgi:ElaB/YqjD/DUF883 family membrane-anchored ribosome-binding protein
MTSTTSASSGSQSSVEQVKEQVQDVAQQAKGKTREQLRTQVSDRSTQAGDQLISAAQAMRRTSDQLREEGNEKMAEIVETLVRRGERVGGYLRAADGDKILRDVENFGRKQPWLMVGGSAVVGFLTSRFMKASSSSRYHGDQSEHAAYYPGHVGRGESSVGGGSTVGYSSSGGATPPPSTVPPLASPNPDVHREGLGSFSPEGGTDGFD